ncbi:tyrosine-type recombinase/integrase [Weissella koreensis]|uniref:site-specific integrase n=1 Tax=Weissella koreensis TaxID=165096 RepID=UPI0022BA6A94|nr:site-specific integrase [Weissella koreensis]MCZ9311622.1 tyrosine-type recombinase/integrase [Weissella koreensis]
MSVRKLKNGKYQVRVYVGTDEVTGHTTYKYRNTDSKTSAIMIEKQLNEAIERGEIVIKELEHLQPQPYTFEEAYKEWWKFYESQDFAQSTKDKVARHFKNHLLKPKLFGNLRLDRIIRIDIQNKVNKFIPQYTQSKEMLGYAKRVFKYAVDSEHIICDSNPLEHIQMVRVKKAPRREVRFYNEIQAKMFEHGINEYYQRGDKFLALFTVLLRTGMRGGELCGLKWKNVDFERCELLLNGRMSLDGHGKDHYLKGLKNGDDFRYIDIDDVVIDKLKSWHYVQAQQSMLKGQPINDESFVFDVLRNQMYSQFASFLEWYNCNNAQKLPYLNIHGLRHTHASLLISSGMDLKKVSDRLGHKDIAVTANIYAELTPKARREVADVFSNIMGDVKENY